MQNYIKSGVNGVQINNYNETQSNKSMNSISNVETEIIDFDANGTVNQATKKITSINLHAIGNNNASSYKSFDELCSMYGKGKTSFSNENVLDMFTNGYASKGMIANYIKSGYVDGSSIGYLLENGAIDVETARSMALKAYNTNINSYGSGTPCEDYLISNDDGKNIGVGNYTYEYAKKETKDGVTTYYDKNGDVLVKYYSDKIEIPKEREIFYYLSDGNYKLEKTETQLTNQFSLNPSFEDIKTVTTYKSDGTKVIEYIDEKTGYSTTVARGSYDVYNDDAFHTIEKDGKVVACRYGTTDKSYEVVLDSDGLKNYSASNNYEKNGHGNMNISEEQFKENYEVISNMDYSSSITKTTTWSDGKEYHYNNKQTLEDGSIVYTMENNMGKKTFLKNGEIVTTISTTTPDGQTLESDTFYKAYSDGTYSVQHNEFMIKYDKTGYNLYSCTPDGHYLFNTHYDYYRG